MINILNSTFFTFEDYERSKKESKSYTRQKRWISIKAIFAKSLVLKGVES